MKLDKILDYVPNNLKGMELEHVCGIDETGRGAGAGPIVTSTVILPKDFSSPIIRDSKKLSKKQLKEAYDLISNNALAISCNAGSAKEINLNGINPMTFKMMHKCLDELIIKPDFILIDGSVWMKYEGENKAPLMLVPQGDDKFLSIASSAIIAKVRRDEYMIKIAEEHPEYNWENNKGYLTKDHIEAIKKYGSTKYHRTQYIEKFI